MKDLRHLQMESTNKINLQNDIASATRLLFCARLALGCVRYIQGYYLGAQSVKPDIKMYSAWVSASDFTKGFFDQTGGRTFGAQFIKQHPGIDVVFQVAGNTGNGVIDAACAAKINAIGVDVDQYQSYPASQPCILTSATKHLTATVAAAIQQISDNQAKVARSFSMQPTTGSASRPSTRRQGSPATSKSKIDAAVAGMKDGSIITCPPRAGLQNKASPDRDRQLTR